jgi:TonB family protein
MRNATGRKFFGGLLILIVVASLACGKKPQAPADEKKTAPGTAPGGEAAPGAALAASAFELKMRILEGGREKPSVPNRPVTSSYLEFLTFANFEDEENVATDEQIKKVFSLTDIGLLTETTLVWEKGRTEKAFHIFRINGQAYLVMVTPGRLPERNQFRIEVYEQSGDELKANLLNTEFSLPEKSSAVFGFENSKLKSYFITLRVARWLGEPAAEGVAGGVAGGVVPNVLKSGEKVKPPKLVKEVAPVYPEAAKKGGIEGVVILEATTDTYGRVASVKILRGDPLLGQAAVEALEQWVYEPMVINGKPKPVVFTVTMQFKLDEINRSEVSGVAGGVELKDGGEKAKMLEKFAAGAVKAEGAIEPPKLVKEAKPVYPEAARAAGVQGVVILSVRADETGKVVDTMVLRSIPLLDQAAMDAVRQWVYEPMIKDGKPVSVVFTVTVRFQLK